MKPRPIKKDGWIKRFLKWIEKASKKEPPHCGGSCCKQETYMLEQYLATIQEGYLLSDKTISVDLDKFESGKANKLLIIGTAGSGKSTLAEYLSKKYKTKWINIDVMWWRLRQKYFKNAPETDETERKLIKKVIEFTIQSLKSNERLIIEGVDLLNIYHEKPEYRKLIINQPIIIFGLSSLRAGIRAGMRNKKRNEEKGGHMKFMYWMVKFNIRHVEDSLQMVRKDIKKLANADIKEYTGKKMTGGSF